MFSKTSIARVSGLALVALLAFVPMGSAQAPTPAIVITETGSNTAVTEGSSLVDTYKVHLASPPASVSLAVTISSASGQVEFVTGTVHSATKVLTFTARDYTVDRVVNVTAVDDAVVEGTLTETLTHTPDASDPAYAGKSATLGVKVTDNDLGLGVVQTGGSTAVKEDPAATDRTDTFTLSLGRAPTADVNVKLSPDTQLSVSTLNVKFTTANWNTPKSITVAAANDAIAQGLRSRPIVFTLTSTDSAYNGLVVPNLPVSITDDDVAGLKLMQGTTELVGNAKLTGSATEGGSTNLGFNAVLTSQPTATVTVTLSSAGGRFAFNPASLSFDATNWQTPVPVTVSAFNNQVDEGDNTVAQTVAISLVPGGADATYGASLARSLQADVLDNDVAAVILKQGTTTLNGGSPSLSGTVDEGTAGLTYAVTLATQPVAPLTMSLTLNVTDAVQVSAATLTFDATTWNSPHMVTLSSPEDQVDRIANGNSRSLNLTHHITAGDAVYRALSDRSVIFTVKENDIAKVVLTSTDTTTVSEAGDTYEYMLHLQSRPLAPVTVKPHPASGSQLVATPSTLTFTDANWATDQAVSLATSDDSTPELDVIAALSHDLTSTDPAYAAASAKPASVSIRVVDNDGVLLIQQSAGTTVATEGATDSYTVALAGNPTGEVTVKLTPSTGAPFTLSATTLTFEPTGAGGDTAPARCPADPTKVCQWNVPQTVTVLATENNVADGTRVGTIQNVAHSTVDTRFNNKLAQVVGVTVLDNDAPGFLFNGGAVNAPAALAANEGASSNLGIRLNSQPSASVHVTIGLAPGLTASPGALDFTTSNWNTAQTVMVSSTQDSVDQGTTYTRAVTVGATSTDAAYAVGSVPAATMTVTDDDTAGYIFNGDASKPNQVPTFTLNEGASNTYTVQLQSDPTSPVTLHVAGQDALASASPATIVFDHGTWNHAVTVTVTAVEDQVDRGTTYTTAVVQTVSGSDPFYATAPGAVAITVNDNDVAAVTVPDDHTSIVEGGPGAVMHAVLATKPLAPVTLTLTASSPSDVQVSPASLTFTDANWDAPQPFTVTAVDDDSPEATKTVTITATASGTDAQYAGKTGMGTLTLADNDGVLLLSKRSVTVTEGNAADSYTVSLVSEPSSAVTVTLTSSDGGQFLVNGARTATLTFEPSVKGVRAPCQSDPTKVSCQWNEAQTVSVSPVNDAVGEPTKTGTITQVTQSADSRFTGANPTIAVTILDNDASLLFSTKTVSVSEGGADATYTIALSRAPTFSVAVSLSTDGQVTATPDTLFFDSDSWAEPQVVTVHAVDDAVAEPTSTHAIHHAVSSADEGYNGMVVADVVATVADNDAVGVSRTQSGGSTDVAEGGATDTVSVSLASQPTQDVVITVSSPDGQLTVAPTTLTFTSANWQTPQDVTVGAVDDATAQGARDASLHFAVSSSDAAYAALTLADLTVHVADNDT